VRFVNIFNKKFGKVWCAIVEPT